MLFILAFYSVFFCQAEDGIRDLVRSRGLGDVYKRQELVKIDSGAATHHVQWLAQAVQPGQSVGVDGAVLLSLIHI